MKFSEQQPPFHTPVWVWCEHLPSEGWRMALLIVDVLPFKEPSVDKLAWSFCGAEIRRALPNDVWELAVKPDYTPMGNT